MHPVRKDIIIALRDSGESSFTQLMQEVAETSDNLTYHLKYLKREGIVDSPSKGLYTLSDKGMVFITTNQEKYAELFPTLSCMLIVRINGGRLLMQKLKQPNIQQIHDVTFALHSEHTVESQIQQFMDNYQVKLADIRYRKTLRLRYFDDGHPVFDKTFIVHECQLVDYESQIDDRKFIEMSTDEISGNDLVMRSAKEIEQILASDELFVEQSYDL